MTLNIGMVTKLMVASALVISLAACNQSTQGKQDSVPQVSETTSPFEPLIRQRQQNFKTIAANFKTLREEAKAGNISSEKAMAALSAMKTLSPDVSGWFPEGSGPETGVKTAALPAIWQENDQFVKLAVRLDRVIERMQGAVERGDLEQADIHFNQIGKTCGACHKKFKLDD